MHCNDISIELIESKAVRVGRLERLNELKGFNGDIENSKRITLSDTSEELRKLINKFLNKASELNKSNIINQDSIVYIDIGYNCIHLLKIKYHSEEKEIIIYENNLFYDKNKITKYIEDNNIIYKWMQLSDCDESSLEKLLIDSSGEWLGSICIEDMFEDDVSYENSLSKWVTFEDKKIYVHEDYYTDYDLEKGFKGFNIDIDLRSSNIVANI